MENLMTVTFPGNKRVDAEYKNFKIPTDQPVYQGGDGTAPAPFDLFLASIATCAGIYVLAFCESRGISLQDASLIMRSQRSAESRRIEKLVLEVRLPAGFPEKYKKVVVKAIDGCAVKQHMLNPPEFEILPIISEA